MGVELEVQSEQEVMQVRSRELQQESVEKLNEIVPVVEDINNINFNQIENNTSEIKEIVSQNLVEQPDISELYEMMKDLTKGISSMKGQITKLSNKVTDLSNIASDLKKEWLYG